MTEDIPGFEEALVQFAAAMDAIGVEYMVTGSTAMNFYAQPRLTRDIDIVIEAGSKDRRLIVEVLAADFEADPDIMREALREKRIFNVFSSGSVKIDVIPRDPRLHPDPSMARRRRFLLSDQEVKVISPEDLIVAKLHWARESRSEMQLRDIRNLLANGDLDLEYINLRVREMRLTSIWSEAHSA